MLTTERHQFILSILKEQGTVKLQELVDQLQASESTIRRDLVQLEEMKLLKRVHGGASLLQRKGLEPTTMEKQYKARAEKQLIAKLAASFIEKNDCIYLDAGTTTAEMIPYLKDKNITVLTNGLMHIPKLIELEIKTVLVGGMIKFSTNAIIGSNAVQFLNEYRFDKCFLGMNGIHQELGFTTPDPEEALLKKMALRLSNETYVLADSSKLNEATFAKVADVSDAIILTDSNDEEAVAHLQKNPKVKVVTI
ncbi:DeoR family transcriptional regulator [Bacillus sp. Soil745]|uniref:DeoR/GlpR family DNA-binding transcription regulator n=1 Tax=Peribacillus TaxID=2675229 RepID=UPI00070FD534|nr:DeoR/GlpR family DNA-binding transcription regulator [Peribacillus frigoritolerans]KRF51569.1 DeoR family transcriptional regulator [Bacillus sp. Soil745]MDP9740632.1 DeoR family fructose operon transcriptional repressor [Bacillus sp. B2I3]PAW29107.1 DeoR family transcriptional regulator [Peribacillus simplex]MDG4846674.1 DeoR/GlpR family DNA-binding transcription regulator [Peribacillus frigoritolerans]MED3708690.1 DeoR/GlpR family DNA-binding transcription regulator [Peribacillus frigorit